VVAPPSPIPGRGSAGDGGAKQVDLLISLAREQALEATKDADAIEAKARAVAQLATVFFAASQATAGLLLAARPESVRPVSDAIAWTTAGLGVLALIAVLLMAWLVMRLHRPVGQDALKPEILERLLKFAHDGNVRVPAYLLNELVDIARSRRNAASTKASALRWIYLAGYGALAASGVQVLLGIVMAFATR
jgi:hypothetical protein